MAAPQSPPKNFAQAGTPEEFTEPKLLEPKLVESKFVEPKFVEPRLVAIPEGWFAMGCATGRDDEMPVHRVWVDGFWLGACQVTRGEYAYFLEATRRPAPRYWEDPNFQDSRKAVVGASWFDAEAYCQWLREWTGKPYRLPTEAEWERAARGGAEDLLYPWGNDPPETLPNYTNRWRNGPEPVGLYAPSAFGLFDIGDNVHEWCADWYDARYYDTFLECAARNAGAERNPQGPERGLRRASRGGSWRHHIKVSRCAARSSIPPEFQYADYGFRVAC